MGIAFERVAEEASTLFQTTSERSSANANYIAKLVNSREASERCDTADNTADADNAKHVSAWGELNVYFKDNIIHKHIKFEKPEDDIWLEIPVLGNRKEIYACGADEVLLMAGFLKRRKEDLAALVGVIDPTGDELLNSRIEANIELSYKHRAEAELDIAKLEARSAEIKRKFAYIEYLVSIARSQ